MSANRDEIERRIERAKREIRSDVISGLVPANVDSFSSLHDFVDANGYGGFFKEGVFDLLGMDATNEIQNSVDVWIKSGGIDVAGKDAAFRVEQRFASGWDDIGWTEAGESMLFPTAMAAQNALDGFIAYQHQAVDREGYIHNNKYDPADYRVAIMAEAFREMAMNPAHTLQAAEAALGWTTDTQVEVLLEFVRELQLQRVFQDYIQGRVRDEQPSVTRSMKM